MRVKYEIDKLQGLVEDFSDITGVELSIRDTEFREIVRSKRERGFCRAIHSVSEGVEKCVLSDVTLLKKCKVSGTPVMDVCHAGLIEIAVPVMKNSVPIGYALLGQIRGQLGFDEIRLRTEMLAVDSKKLKAEYDALIYYEDRKLESLVNLVSALSALILSDGMMREEYTKLSENIAEYIENNLDKKLTVEKLCTELHISKNILYEHFHYDFGSTVSDYITRRRAERAMYLLSSSELSLGAVAERCGIGSYTYFFKIIKIFSGMTPTEYRKVHR